MDTYYILYERTHENSEKALLGLIKVRATDNRSAVEAGKAKLDAFNVMFKDSRPRFTRKVIGVLSNTHVANFNPSIFVGVQGPIEPTWHIGGEVVR
jgi:hypothetical protein